MASRSRAGDEALVRFLIQCGRIDAEKGRAAAAEAVAAGENRSALDCLVASGAVDEEEIAALLADRLHLRTATPAGFSFDPAVIRLVKEEVAARYVVVPLGVENGALLVATANPLDREALRAIEFATGMRVRAQVATLTAVRDAVRHAYHLEESLDAYLHGVKAPQEGSLVPLEEESGDLGSLAEASDLPPVVKLLNLILMEGIRAGASDIHIEPSPATVQVRYRIDGLLEEGARLPKWVGAPLTARCKVLAKLDITERRVPQDGRIALAYHKQKIDLRVSSLPTQHGEKITMRILNANAAAGGLDKLQLNPREREVIMRAIRRPEGIVLVTGPTGSGKSTTLYAMIHEIAHTTRNIVTIENPIEYQVKGINQVEVNEKQGLTFATTLRSILRQDPDVILVGEIRDGETAEIALRAAQTGHLVLSTLHTNDTVATLARLIDLGIEPYMLAGALHMVLAQRLVRRVCPQCSAPDQPDVAELSKLDLAPGADYRRGKGCDACRHSGYAGRMAVLEVLDVTPRIAKLIEAKAPESAIRQQAQADGMLLLHQSAADKVRAGLTTIEEALRVVDSAAMHESGEHCPQCRKPVQAAFKVCPFCLASLRHECASCHQPLQEGWQVCPFCMTRVPGGAAAPTAAPEVAAPAAAVTPASTAPPEIAAAPPPASPSAAESAAAEGERPYTALVVDDAADMRRLISVSLERGDIGVRVLTAENGAEGLARAIAERPDVIVLDVMMPEMDGFEVCRRLRANMRTTFIPILMLTTLGDLAHREKGFLAGTDDYIAKPFNRQDLVARVRRLLQRNYGADFAEAGTAAVPEGATG